MEEEVVVRDIFLAREDASPYNGSSVVHRPDLLWVPGNFKMSDTRKRDRLRRNYKLRT